METERLGYAGRIGVVYGVTVPSETGVGPVVGEVGDGAAINAHFHDLDEGAWFAPELVEPVEGWSQTVPWMTVGGVRYVRDADTTRVELVHSGFERLGDQAREGYSGYADGWGRVLVRYAERTTA